MKKIIILTSLLTASISIFASEIDDDNVIQEQLDVEQKVHWQWCGKNCREHAAKKAKKVLRRLDNLVTDYDSQESFYEDAADIFKKKATLKQWTSAFEKRKVLSNPIRRVHESTQGTFRNLPNVDKNKKYVIVTFDTMFEGEKGIFTEQITLIRKKDNRYKFIGYYFAKKPYYEY